jgi:glucokinase
MEEGLVSETFFVGVDIGGTKVAAGLVNNLGEIVKHVRSHMITNADAATGLGCVLSAIQELLCGLPPNQRPIALGACAPGPLDPRKGVIINPPNVPCWRNFPLADELQRVFDMPVKVENDAKAAGLAEVLWGAGRGYTNVFYATVGTGIGAAIIFSGKIYHGRTGAAAEAGHMGIQFDGPRCPCGKKGCIEFLASGPAIARRARKKLQDHPKSSLLEMVGGNLDNVTGEMVGKASSAKDPVAMEVVEETLDLLAYWLGNVLDFLEPDVMIMGGGVSTMLASHLEEIRARWKGAVLNPWPELIPLVLARYGEEAGIAGAAALCRATS